MANASPMVPVTFKQALEDFKKTLSQDEIHDFGFATLMDLKKLISDIQNDQASSRRMKNLNRLAPFLEAMEQYDKIVQVFLNTTNILAFVWGPMKFLLQTASTYSDSFNALLDAYQEIGEILPLLANYERVLRQKNSSLHPVLGLVYTDIMEFHRSAMKYFRGPVWHQIFHAVWKNFKTRFDRILVNLARHRRMVDSHADLVLLEQLREDRARTDAKFETIEQEEARKKRVEVTRWLSAADSFRDHSLALSRRADYPQTGKWLLQQSSLQKWMDFSNFLDPILWINGKPGAGKTVLASLLIDECRMMAGAKTAFFYCKHGDPTRNCATAVFRGILLQLLDMEPFFIPYVYEVASNSGRSTLDDLDRVKKILEVVLAAFGKLYMIIDGLDECPKAEKAAIVKWWLATTTNGPSASTGTPRCCLFSQDDNDLGSLLKSALAFKITSRHNRGDISIYCDSQADKIKAKFDLPEDKAHDVSITVSKRADGMFIYARLVMESLLSHVNRKNFNKECKELPVDLDQVYGRIVHRVLHESEPAECDAAKRILSWLVCATRPLKWYEIQGAASFDPDDHSYDFEDGKFRHQPKTLCGSFIEVIAGEEIRLVHLTAKTYLEQNVFNIAEQELELLCHSLDYLQLTAFKKDLSEDEVTPFVLDGYYAFMDYSVANWCTHLHNVLKSSGHNHDHLSRLRDLVKSFFKSHPGYRPKGQQIGRDITTLLHHFKCEEFFEDLCHAFSSATTLVSGTGNGTDLQQEKTSYSVSSIPLIRRAIEGIASGSDPSKTERLKECYGCRLFKCPLTYCSYFHEGFLSLGDRDHHLTKHRRPYCCTFPGCPATIGFKTERELRKHNSDYHERNVKGGTFPQTESLSPVQVCNMIRRGAFDELDAWIDHFDGHIPISEVWSNTLMRPLRAAYEKGDQVSLAVLLDHVDPALLHDKKAMEKIIRGAIKAHKNEDVLQDSVAILLDRVEPGFFDDEKAMGKIIAGAMEVHNEPAAMEILERTPKLADHIIRVLVEASLREGLDRFSCKLLSHPNCNLSLESRQHEYLWKVLQHHRVAVARFLVCEKDIDVNVPNPSVNVTTRRVGFLEEAAGQNDIRLAKILLQSSRGIKRESKVSAAKIAARHDYMDFAHTLYDTVPRSFGDEEIMNGVLLLQAARDADFDQVNRITAEGGVILELQDSSGRGPLHYAVEKNKTSAVRNLLEKGNLRVDQSPDSLAPGQNMLSCAIKNANVEIVRLLLTYGDFSAYGSPSRDLKPTYYDIAEESRNTEIIHLLLMHGQTDILADLEIESLPDNLKKEGSDWFAVFNPRVQRAVDVDLIHDLPHQSVVCCLRFSLDGRFLATSCNCSAQIFSVETGTPVAHLQDNNLPKGDDNYVRCVCFSPNGAYLATGGESKVVTVWDIASRTVTHQFTGHNEIVYSLDFAQNGRIIASGSGDMSVRLWDLENNQEVLSLFVGDIVTSVAFSPDSCFLAAGLCDKSIRVWNPSNGGLIVNLAGEQGHKDSVYSVAFSPFNNTLASCGLDNTIKMWELRVPPRLNTDFSSFGKCFQTFRGHKDFVLSVAFTPHGAWILSGSKDCGVQFWDPQTGVSHFRLQGHKNSVTSVANSATMGIFATASSDMRARIWRYGPYHSP